MLQLFLKTKRFIPCEFHDSFFEIDFKNLHNNGYKTILCDLDNTLISYDENIPTEALINKFQEIDDLGLELILISNNIPTRIQKFTKNLSLKGIPNARKPLLIGMIKALKLAQVQDKDKVVVIGDQLMTDIWAANRFGVYNILVNPIKKKTEKWYTKINRKTELKVLQKIKSNYSQKYKDLRLDMRK